MNQSIIIKALHINNIIDEICVHLGLQSVPLINYCQFHHHRNGLIVTEFNWILVGEVTLNGNHWLSTNLYISLTICLSKIRVCMPRDGRGSIIFGEVIRAVFSVIFMQINWRMCKSGVCMGPVCCKGSHLINKRNNFNIRSQKLLFK